MEVCWLASSLVCLSVCLSLAGLDLSISRFLALASNRSLASLVYSTLSIWFACLFERNLELGTNRDSKFQGAGSWLLAWPQSFR